MNAFASLFHTWLLSLSFVVVPMDGRALEHPPASMFVPVGIVQTQTRLGRDLALRLPEHAPLKIDPSRLGIETAARSVLVMDRRTQAVLYEKGGGDVRSIGSITKLMTALVALESGMDLAGQDQIYSEDVIYGGLEHIPPNDPVRVRDLLASSLIASDNSATAALARASGLSPEQFIEKMNAKAQELHMDQTTFADPSGILPENRSSAFDVALLLNAAMEQPQITEFVTKRELTLTTSRGRTIKLANTNELFSSFLDEEPYQILSGKTGYLPTAGYCLAAAVREENGGDLIVVVLGAPGKDDRFFDAEALAAWSFDAYAWSDAQ
ncbi:D-alanyl-D-alanine carboxypeptidase [Candidatus Uhrbacteria bacterium]|nr:D-alanyl-D-alanine carboxypeptidase [Candidatus Uhrbacteria bacterium]